MDNQNLISKKELLAKYGISYGSLYRWKRMGLIPEEWFIKTSTVTGQETFFDRDTVCERIELIISMKDNTSLEALARQLNPPANKEQKLTVKTPYGTKSFKREDIKGVELSGESVIDVTDKILALFDELMKG